MKIIIKRHGLPRHGISMEGMACPECKSEFIDIKHIEYTTNDEYILDIQCEDCLCLFEIKTDSAKKFD